MKKSKTSTYYFKFPVMDVYEAVTYGGDSNNMMFTPMSDSDYEEQRDLKNGKILAHVTDRTPGVSCSYVVNAEKFDIFWSAEFKEVRGECQMKMTETYVFHKGAVMSFILAILFIKQKEQHDAFREEIANRLLYETYKTSKKRYPKK